MIIFMIMNIPLFYYCVPLSLSPHIYTISFLKLNVSSLNYYKYIE